MVDDIGGDAASARNIGDSRIILVIGTPKMVPLNLGNPTSRGALPRSASSIGKLRVCKGKGSCLRSRRIRMLLFLAVYIHAYLYVHVQIYIREGPLLGKYPLHS